jgi:hypothetical protein
LDRYGKGLKNDENDIMAELDLESGGFFADGVSDARDNLGDFVRDFADGGLAGIHDVSERDVAQPESELACCGGAWADSPFSLFRFYPIGSNIYIDSRIVGGLGPAEAGRGDGSGGRKVKIAMEDLDRI